MKNRLPPQSIEAEMLVLGAVLLENKALKLVRSLLDAEDFYREPHRKIFRAMLELYEMQEPCDLITLTMMLKKRGELAEAGGGAYLGTLVDYVPTAANVESYCRIVKEKSIARKLINASTEIITRGYDEGVDVRELLERAQRDILELSEEDGDEDDCDPYLNMDTHGTIKLCPWKRRKNENRLCDADSCMAWQWDTYVMDGNHQTEMLGHCGLVGSPVIAYRVNDSKRPSL